MQIKNNILPGEFYAWDLPKIPALRYRLMQFVCFEFNIPRESMFVPGGKRNLCDAKKAFVLLSREVLRDSYIRIAMELKRDRTTMIHLHQAAENLMKLKNDSFGFKVERIKRKLLN